MEALAAMPHNKMPQCSNVESRSTLDLSVLLRSQEDITIWNLQLQNTAICDLTPRCLLRFSCGTCYRKSAFAILGWSLMSGRRTSGPGVLPHLRLLPSYPSFSGENSSSKKRVGVHLEVPDVHLPDVGDQPMAAISKLSTLQARFFWTLCWGWGFRRLDKRRSCPSGRLHPFISSCKYRRSQTGAISWAGKM